MLSFLPVQRALFSGVALMGASAPAGPVNSVAPVISGSAPEGSVVTCTTGTWSGSPSGYTYEFKRNGVGVTSASSTNTYLRQLGDVGASITCTVVATNGSGSASADSNALTDTTAAALGWNPNDQSATGLTVSGTGNRIATVSTGGADRKVRSASAYASGAPYVEVIINTIGGADYPILGWATGALSLASGSFLGGNNAGCGFVCGDASMRQGGSTLATAGSAVSAGERIGFGYNKATGDFLVKRSSTEYVVTLPAPLAANVFLCFNGFNGTDQVTIQTSSTLGVPTGYTYKT